MRKLFTKEDNQKLITLYKEGYTILEICKIMNRSRACIRRKIHGDKRFNKPSILPQYLQKPKRKISRTVKTPSHTVEKSKQETKSLPANLKLVVDLFEFADSPHTPPELKAQADALGRAIFLLEHK